MPNLDVVSVEIAEKLREAGWTRAYPQVGDWFQDSNGDARLWFIGETPGWRFPPDALHLPSRCDLELALEEMGYAYCSYGHFAGSTWQFRCCNDPNWHVYIDTEAETPADAVALAWLEAKRREQDADS